MRIEEMKKIAHANNHEFSVDRDGDICIRPMMFDDDGVRQLRYQPDPCEFERPEKAEAWAEQKQLEELICWHKYLYYHRAHSVISDYAYDMLERKLKDQFPDSPVLHEARYIECPEDLWPEYDRQWAAGRRDGPPI